VYHFQGGGITQNQGTAGAKRTGGNGKERMLGVPAPQRALDQHSKNAPLRYKRDSRREES